MPSRRYKRKQTSRRRSQRRSRRSSRKLRRYRSVDAANKYREMKALYEKDITLFELNHGTTPIIFHGQYKENGFNDSFLYVKGTVTPHSFNDVTINVIVSIEEFYKVRHGFFNKKFQEVAANADADILPIAQKVPLEKIQFDDTVACPLYGGIDEIVVAFVNDRFATSGRTFVQTNVFLPQRVADGPIVES